MNLFTRAYIAMKTKRLVREDTRKSEQSLVKDERGVSAIVATVILMLIVVLLAVVFWEQISTWFSNMIGKIFGEADPDNFNRPDVPVAG